MIALMIALMCMLPVFPGRAEAPVFAGEGIPTVEMRMAGYTYAGVQALIADLEAAGLPGSVDIRPAKVPIEDLMAVCEALPEVRIFCLTDVLGIEADTSCTELDLSGAALWDTESFGAMLNCFPRLSSAVMCDMPGTDNAFFERMQAQFPQIKFVWKVYFGTWSLRTDALSFSTLNSNDSVRYTSEDFSVLKYCTELRALDLGHNVITDLSFLESMPEMKILILADNRISDIGPLAKLKKLEYLELFMNDIVDFSPLSGLDRLLDLNLCHNKAVDASPLKSLVQLERLWLSYNREMPKSETEAVQEALPNCLCNFEIFYSTHGNWRGHDRYAVVKWIFDRGEYVEWDADVPSAKEQFAAQQGG